MRLIKKFLFIIVVSLIAAFSGCGSDMAGVAPDGVDDGLSSDFFIKNLVVEAPALYDETDPNSSTLDLKWDFQPGVWKNEADVPNKVDKVTLTAVTMQAWATMFIDGVELKNGVKSDPIPLNNAGEGTDGENIIKIRVVAQDKQENDYEFKIRRHSAGYQVATLKTLTVTGASGVLPLTGFSESGSEREFSLSTTDDTIAINAQPSAAGTNVEVMVDDPADIELDQGLNQVKIMCTAGDRVTKETYTININRQVVSTSAKLSALSINGTSLDSFSPDTTMYSVSLKTAAVTLQMQTEAANADKPVVTVNSGTPVTVESGSVDLSLSEGDNTIAIVVTNGGNTETYTIEASVTLSSLSSDTTLKTLKVTVGTDPRVIHPGTFDRANNYHDANSVKFTSSQKDYVTVIYGFNSINVAAAVNDSNAQVVFSAETKFNGTNGTSGGITSQTFASGTGTAAVSLDPGYVTHVIITVTAADGTTEPYHLYAKLLNVDEYYWGIYAPAFDKSKSSWPTPSGISDKTYNGSVSGTSRWATGLASASFQGSSYGAKSEIILTNFNDGTNGLIYNEGGFVINGTQYTYLKSATAKNGFNVTNKPYTVTTPAGDSIADFYYHLVVSSSQPVQHAAGTTDPLLQSYTNITYMGTTDKQYFRSNKPNPFTDSSYNWFAPWADNQDPTGAVMNP